ncbi:MAG: aminoglycoside phosphotransferase family protein [Acaryochloris sp. RU_4_1]|nr:aminoglycoside phosphotransferase family protein [Acaryochloris sp. RU_4_1]NJR53272.1 aminoglycoside phosphotransferase family protein [Acaryochloris sp. CRU_2_0]
MQETTFLLGTQNVFEYLIAQGFCEPEEKNLSQIYPKICKNFNLLVSLPNHRHLLLKQEPHNRLGKTRGELLKEWQIYDFIHKFPRLNPILSIIAEAIHFDASHSIIIFDYLHDYCDLDEFYTQEPIFPTAMVSDWPLAIATAIGAVLATIHRTTFDCLEYKDFLSKQCADLDHPPSPLHGLERLKPEIFAEVSADGLKFFELYQRHASLGKAILELNKAFDACCLTHNDLKLNNILLHLEWEQILAKKEKSTSPLRFIDWEKWSWGDPAFDLGTLIASYLKIWLSSLAIDPEIDIETALSLATTPLEVLQPSIIALTQSYFACFPKILSRRPDFLNRVVQFTGLALIERIRAMVHYQEPFDNIGICMLQVAKTLLCDPQQALPIIFGISASELTPAVLLPT